VTRD
jgi:hypothetical protein